MSGLLNTNDTVTRVYLPDSNIVLQINDLIVISNKSAARYSLSWYHNGTKITDSDRISITNNGTALTIFNMIDSDAGKYEVKVGSIDYGGLTSSSECDQNILPILEVAALNAPVTFIVQQYHMPKYDPQDIIEMFTLDSTNDNFIINKSIAINNLYFGSTLNKYFYKNGTSLSLSTGHFTFTQSYENEILLSHQIRYNNTEDVTGHYVYFETINANKFRRRRCDGYYDYIRDIMDRPRFPVFILYWTLLSNGK